MKNLFKIIGLSFILALTGCELSNNVEEMSVYHPPVEETKANFIKSLTSRYNEIIVDLDTAEKDNVNIVFNIIKNNTTSFDEEALDEKVKELDDLGEVAKEEVHTKEELKEKYLNEVHLIYNSIEKNLHEEIVPYFASLTTLMKDFINNQEIDNLSMEELINIYEVNTRSFRENLLGLSSIQYTQEAIDFIINGKNKAKEIKESYKTKTEDIDLLNQIEGYYVDCINSISKLFVDGEDKNLLLEEYLNTLEENICGLLNISLEKD